MRASTLREHIRKYESIPAGQKREYLSKVYKEAVQFFDENVQRTESEHVKVRETYKNQFRRDYKEPSIEAIQRIYKLSLPSSMSQALEKVYVAPQPGKAPDLTIKITKLEPVSKVLHTALYNMDKYGTWSREVADRLYMVLHDIEKMDNVTLFNKSVGPPSVASKSATPAEIRNNLRDYLKSYKELEPVLKNHERDIINVLTDIAAQGRLSREGKHARVIQTMELYNIGYYSSAELLLNFFDKSDKWHEFRKSLMKKYYDSRDFVDELDMTIAEFDNNIDMEIIDTVLKQYNDPKEAIDEYRRRYREKHHI